MSSWTKTEIATYKPRENDYLKSLYDIVGLPPTDPEGRARFLLAELGLTARETFLAVVEGKEGGKHVELALLEDLAIEAREEQPQRNSRIQLP